LILASSPSSKDYHGARRLSMKSGQPGVYTFNHPGVETVKMPDGSIQKAAISRSAEQHANVRAVQNQRRKIRDIIPPASNNIKARLGLERILTLLTPRIPRIKIIFIRGIRGML
jgi:hypothetical protein